MVFRDRSRLFLALAALVLAGAVAKGVMVHAEGHRAELAPAAVVKAMPPATVAVAPRPLVSPEDAAVSEARAHLQKAMHARVIINTDPHTGRTVDAYHCRRAPEGCDQRMSEFAGYLTDAAARNHVDPWLLAAMAFKESGFNPFAKGAMGELGILQLHPGNPRSKHVRFLHDEWYRMRCRKEPGACQREVVERAAQLLAKSVEQCGGDVKAGLAAYNTGRCDGNKGYAKRILGERDLLRTTVGLKG